jgi:hypothetical protein
MSLLLLNETTPTLHDLPRKKTKQKFHSFLLRCKTCKKAVIFSAEKKLRKIRSSAALPFPFPRRSTYLLLEANHA